MVVIGLISELELFAANHYIVTDNSNVGRTRRCGVHVKCSRRPSVITVRLYVIGACIA